MHEQIEQLPIRALLVEDNPGDARLVREELALSPRLAFELVHVSRLSAGIEQLERGGIDVVLLDLSLPDSTGLPTFESVRDHAPDTPVIILTGLADEDVAMQAVEAGAQDYLVKGEFDGGMLARAARYAIRRHRRMAGLRALSMTDDLTGLYNRRGFIALAEQQLRLAARNSQGMLLLFLDLDGLKQINDTFGHDEGNQALLDTAQILRRTFRACDILARLSGDEFAVLAVDTDAAAAEAIVRRLREQLRLHNLRSERPYELSFSVGVASYAPFEQPTLAALVKQADERMYADKQARRVLSPPTLFPSDR